jgi:hypothetical protein
MVILGGFSFDVKELNLENECGIFRYQSLDLTGAICELGWAGYARLLADGHLGKGLIPAADDFPKPKFE